MWFKRLFPGNLIWDLPAGAERSVYLTFDDGPHPDITPRVLDLLQQHDATATFFCVGNNVRKYPDTYERILNEGHSVGNHTYDHLNGWRTETRAYTNNIAKAAGYIKSRLFRPPYGKIRYSQIWRMRKSDTDWRIVMWSVLSADFDTAVSPEACLDNVVRNLQPGSVVVFHDSVKALERLEYALPRVLDHCRQQGFKPRAIPMI